MQNHNSICARFFLAVLAAALLLTASPARGTLMRSLSVAELSAHADTVLRGRVISVRVDWAPVSNLPVTVVELQVLEVLSGHEPGRRVRITQPGGVKGDISLDYAGRPLFRADQETVLFLKEVQQGQFITVALAQGKFDVGHTDTRGRRLLHRNLHGAVLLDQGGASPPDHLEELRSRLRALPQVVGGQ